MAFDRSDYHRGMQQAAIDDLSGAAVCAAMRLAGSDGFTTRGPPPNLSVRCSIARITCFSTVLELMP
jgi:hypothetical protein